MDKALSLTFRLFQKLLLWLEWCPFVQGLAISYSRFKAAARPLPPGHLPESPRMTKVTLSLGSHSILQPFPAQGLGPSPEMVFCDLIDFASSSRPLRTPTHPSLTLQGRGLRRRQAASCSWAEPRLRSQPRLPATTCSDSTLCFPPLPIRISSFVVSVSSRPCIPPNSLLPLAFIH